MTFLVNFLSILFNSEFSVYMNFVHANSNLHDLIFDIFILSAHQTRSYMTCYLNMRTSKFVTHHPSDTSFCVFGLLFYKTLVIFFNSPFGCKNKWMKILFTSLNCQPKCSCIHQHNSVCIYFSEKFYFIYTGILGI